MPGASNPDLAEIHEALRLTTSWSGGVGSAGPLSGAVMAVATGQARHVVLYRTVKEGSAGRRAGGRPAYGSTSPTAAGALAWVLPIGGLSVACQLAPIAARYMHDYQLRRDQLAWISVTQRAHASANPDAVYRDPLTVEDYLQSRMISTPLCLFDCDVPVDASTAIVVSAAETSGDLRAPIRIESMAGVREGATSWYQVDRIEALGRRTAAALWSRTDLKPTDVDVAQLYDGFSISVVCWLEALGFCGTGEAGSFIEGGGRISVGGELPLNTWGGQLSGGRLHAGFGHIAEAVRQLRGEARGRQVAGAEVAVVTSAGVLEGGAALLTR